MSETAELLARIDELEAERDRLAGKSQLAHEIAAGAMANAKRLLAENARLRKIIEDAPHDPRECIGFLADSGEIYGHDGTCTCWKAALARISLGSDAAPEAAK